MAMCYQKHPFEIETEDRLTTINTKIFEIKKKIQLSGAYDRLYLSTYVLSSIFLNCNILITKMFKNNRLVFYYRSLLILRKKFSRRVIKN